MYATAVMYVDEEKNYIILKEQYEAKAQRARDNEATRQLRQRMQALSQPQQCPLSDPLPSSSSSSSLSSVVPMSSDGLVDTAKLRDIAMAMLKSAKDNKIPFDRYLPTKPSEQGLSLLDDLIRKRSKAMDELVTVVSKIQDHIKDINDELVERYKHMMTYKERLDDTRHMDRRKKNIRKRELEERADYQKDVAEMLAKRCKIEARSISTSS